MIVFLLLSTVATLCLARPNIHDVDPQNMVTVPPNCPAGQELINGQCREVWRADSVCPRGQQLANGQCHETSRAIDYQTDEELFSWKTGADINGMPPNMVTVPPNCPAGQELINGACREIWKAGFQSDGAAIDPIIWKTGADINGLPPNMVTVPPNCPAGQELINGACREIWKAGFQSSGAAIDPIMESNLMQALLKSMFTAQEMKRQNYEDDEIGSFKNIISVPNQCPAGYRPDALGICREIFA